MSLTARTLEAGGIPTVIIGAALDILVEVGVPRAVFVDVPLGNPVGPPYDLATQRSVVELALSVGATAAAPRTIVQAPVRWPTDDWRSRYMHVGDDNRAELARLGEERRARQAAMQRNQ